jgi:hypothetical protein
MGYVQQGTVQYKTYVKRALVESLQEAFAGNADPTVQVAKMAIDFTEDDFTLPAIIIKFNESQLPNAGVGHFEWLPSPITADPTDPSTDFIEYQHRMYKGDIEFDIYGESSADRDVLSDALVELLAMNEVSVTGSQFMQRFYQDFQNTPYGLWHYPTLNLDQITATPEQNTLAPWNPEDQLVYQVSYRVPIFGEFYSYTPPDAVATGPITEVDVYSWPTDASGDAIDPQKPAPTTPGEIPEGAEYQDYTGWPAPGDPGSELI